jgi:hypothetical protein
MAKRTERTRWVSYLSSCSTVLTRMAQRVRVERDPVRNLNALPRLRFCSPASCRAGGVARRIS